MNSYSRVLCAIDLSRRSELVVRRAIQIAHACQADLTVLAVIDFHTGFESDHYPFRTPGEIKNEMIRTVDARLKEMLEQIGAGWVKRLVVAGQPDQIAMQQAKDWDAKLVIVGSHAPHGMETLKDNHWWTLPKRVPFDLLVVNFPRESPLAFPWLSVPFR